MKILSPFTHPYKPVGLRLLTFVEHGMEFNGIQVFFKIFSCVLQNKSQSCSEQQA